MSTINTIEDLTAIGGALAAGDKIPFADISDGNRTKSATPGNVLSGAWLDTVQELTASGAVTVASRRRTAWSISAVIRCSEDGMMWLLSMCRWASHTFASSAAPSGLAPRKTR